MMHQQRGLPSNLVQLGSLPAGNGCDCVCWPVTPGASQPGQAGPVPPCQAVMGWWPGVRVAVTKGMTVRFSVCNFYF